MSHEEKSMVGKVLVVDDEDTLRLTIKTRLTAGGFETDAAVDGEEAIEKLKQTPFDVVLLDINMPRMDGITALGMITELRPNTDVIMLTGFADFSTAIECLKKGAKDYLVKPIDTTELITRMRSLLRARNSEAALTTLKREHASFVFDRVVDPASKIQLAAAKMIEGGFGKITKEQSVVLKAIDEFSAMIVSGSVQSLDPAFLSPGGGAEHRKEVSLDTILNGVEEYAAALASASNVEWVSELKGKLPKIACDESLLREAFRSVVTVAVGLAAKNARVTVSTEKETADNMVTLNVAVDKLGERGKKVADQLAKPLDSIGGQLQKLGGEMLLLYFAQRTLMAHGGKVAIGTGKKETVFACTVAKKGIQEQV